MTSGGANGGGADEQSPNDENVARVSVTDVDHLNQWLGDMNLDPKFVGGWDDLCKEKKNEGDWGEWDESYTQIPPIPDDIIQGYYDSEKDSDAYELDSDFYDSDDSQTSHDSRKKNPWFSVLFKILDELTAEQITEPNRQFHCPACQNGPGAIYWYRGMPSLVTHIKTKGNRRPKIHRDLAEILVEELNRRGATLVKPGVSYGEWEGLVDKDVKDWKIVWPPMVVIMNTQLKQDENDKWIGMGGQELLHYFDSYEPVKARHSYGPDGHRGMSLLIFDPSATGYLEAEYLSQHFKMQNLDRDAWDHNPNLFHPSGKRQLYGFMATEKDLDDFNLYATAKYKLKFDLVSYREKVMNHLKQMRKDCKELHLCKKQIEKLEKNLKETEDALDIVSRKLLILEDENYNEETGFKEENSEKVGDKKSSAVVDADQREKEILKGDVFTKEEKDNLIKAHEKEKAEMKRKHEKEIAEIGTKLNQLLEKCSSSITHSS